MFEENYIIGPPNQSNMTSSVLCSNTATHVPPALFRSPHSHTSQPLIAKQGSKLLVPRTSPSQWFPSSCLGNWFLVLSARHISEHIALLTQMPCKRVRRGAALPAADQPHGDTSCAESLRNSLTSSQPAPLKNPSKTAQKSSLASPWPWKSWGEKDTQQQTTYISRGHTAQECSVHWCLALLWLRKQ